MNEGSHEKVTRVDLIYNMYNENDPYSTTSRSIDRSIVVKSIYTQMIRKQIFNLICDKIQNSFKLLFFMFHVMNPIIQLS